MKAVALILVFYLAGVIGDCYLHNPRGSNGRLNEANQNRQNANRLMDTQNNAKGGYCYGPAMSYYEKSQLTLEWTSQHGCGNSKLYCNIVLQYLCSDSDADPTIRVRDGTTTNSIPLDDTGAVAVDANGELMYGMHESFENYKACATRLRNPGLWISDREEEGNLNEDRDARFTRQNNNANQHGYECAEERDYYPYWAPSPWKDIAVLVNDPKHCDFYTKESNNVAPKGKCVDKTDEKVLLPPNNPGACGIAKGTWKEEESKKIEGPECIQAQWARDNHLGNGMGGYANNYNWTLPSASVEPCIEKNNCNCVIRIRYNISTTDVNFLNDGSVIDGNNPSEGFIDWEQNAGNSPVTDDMIVPGSGMDHQLALDTTQYGRTFEDRSHVFHILSRSEGGVPDSAKIYNLNVRGKRGNIVQAYPAVEYDFIPEILYVHVGDYIHFQWTGCDTNPAGNAGEGTDQTDRSNVVQIADMGANVPATDTWFESNTPLFEDPTLRKRMAFLDQTDCKTYEELLAQNNNNANDAKTDVQNCMKLNAASQYFNGGAIRMNSTTGEKTPFYYMSSRNNNFSNRGQKGAIYVTQFLPTWAIGVVVAGAGLFVAASAVGGAAFYAKSHPHSALANAFSKL